MWVLAPSLLLHENFAPFPMITIEVYPNIPSLYPPVIPHASLNLASAANRQMVEEELLHYHIKNIFNLNTLTIVCIEARTIKEKGE